MLFYPPSSFPLGLLCIRHLCCSVSARFLGDPKKTELSSDLALFSSAVWLLIASFRDEVSTHTHTQTATGTHGHTHAHTCVSTHTGTCTHTRACTHIHTHTHPALSCYLTSHIRNELRSRNKGQDESPQELVWKEKVSCR